MADRKLPEMMTGAEVGDALRVDPKTVSRYAAAGRFRYQWFEDDAFINGTGHLRFYRAEIEAYVAGAPLTEAQLDALVRGEL